jgi:hypothetical protein
LELELGPVPWALAKLPMANNPTPNTAGRETFLINVPPLSLIAMIPNAHIPPTFPAHAREAL